MEKKLRDRLQHQDPAQFGAVGLSLLLVIFWVAAVFRKPIKDIVAKETAGLAKETLDNETLQSQTKELATAVVQTILTNQEITAQAALFLRIAASTPETQAAMVKVGLHVLQHPDTLVHATVLVKQLLETLVNDKVSE